MKGHIKLLPDSVANQIAAGEVVNRPASVVKELVENAVDAGAKSITVNFRDGGRELIQIRDDGCGMSAQDARMAFERHATSKIVSVDDIYSLSTFGFRGEALASIAAVAQVEVHTRLRDEELGTRLYIEGGAFKSSEAVAAPAGTQMWVRNLFYNVPARKKFLDRATTEATHITGEFQRVALAHPDVAFKLLRDDAPLYDLPAGSLHQRVVGVAGRGSAAKFVEVGVETSLGRVRGYVGRPQAARQRCREQFLFVNGRFFKSALFHKAIVQAYDKLIPATVQPPYFIYMDVAPDQIDVNVHPQKTEVKFTNQSAVWQIINAAVRETLAKSGSVPMMDFESEDRIEIPVMPSVRGGAGVAEPLDHTGAFGGDDTGTVREPAQVRRTDYNPFTQYAAGDDDARSFTGGFGAGRGADFDSDFAPSGDGFGGSSGGDFGSDISGTDLPSGIPVSDFGSGISGANFAPAAGRSGMGTGTNMWADTGLASGDGDFASSLGDVPHAGGYSGVEEDTDSDFVSGIGGMSGGAAAFGESEFEYIDAAEDSPADFRILSPADDCVDIDSADDLGHGTCRAGSAQSQGPARQAARGPFASVTGIGRGYAAAMWGGALVAVDLRRAHEAVLYDRFAAMLRSGHGATQRLLFPERMAMSAADATLLKDHEAEFAALGFDIRAAGDHAVEIHGTPSDLPDGSMEDVIYGVLDELLDDTLADAAARRKGLAAAMARAGAISHAAAARLSPEAVEELLKSLAATANPSFTPRGKAVVVEITIDEIKEKLK